MLITEQRALWDSAMSNMVPASRNALKAIAVPAACETAPGTKYNCSA